MMDIVEQLRALPDSEVGQYRDEVLDPAADKIERLLVACMDKTILLHDAYAQIERVQEECEQQARLNGMGAERELALRAEIERLQGLLENSGMTVQELLANDGRLRTALDTIIGVCLAREDGLSAAKVHRIAHDALGGHVQMPNSGRSMPEIINGAADRLEYLGASDDAAELRTVLSPVQGQDKPGKPPK